MFASSLGTLCCTIPARPNRAVRCQCRKAYRTIMWCYAAVCSLWIPLLAWMMPSHSFRVGMMYLRRSDWTFEVRLRTGELLYAACSDMLPRQSRQGCNLRLTGTPHRVTCRVRAALPTCDISPRFCCGLVSAS